MKRPRISSTSTLGSPGALNKSTFPGLPEDEGHIPKALHMEPRPTSTKLHCDLPPHELLSFSTYADYETHYSQTHVNRCLECHRNLPTDHFLSLHIAENHDPITATKRDRGDKTYHCFLEGCGKVCSSWQKRKLHLIDKHMFPRNYDFLIVNDGIDGRRSMLRPDRPARPPAKKGRNQAQGSSEQPSEALMSCGSDEDEVIMTPESTGTDEVDLLANAVASLKFVPQSVRFGRKKGLSGLSKT